MGTGIKVSAKRGGTVRELDIEQLTDEELHDLLKRATPSQVRAYAFPQSGLPRVAIIFPQSPSFDQPLREQLTARGFVQGKNVNLDWRSYKTWDATMESMVAELVRSSPDVIVVAGTPATRAVLRQTKTIPVVFDVGDPLATGLLSSLSHPDRNATGVSTTSVESSAKVFDLVTQLVPDARRFFEALNQRNYRSSRSQS